MNRFLVFSALIFLISCSAKGRDNGLTKSALKGQWKFVTVVKVKDTPFLHAYPDPHTPPKEEGPPQPPYTGPDLIFENDTMYVVNYPTVLLNRNNFSVASGYLYKHFERYIDSFPVELVNDTLFVYKPLYGNEYAKEGYVKTSFNDSIITILKKYEVNYPELAGTWMLIRELSFNDGSENYVLKFPYKIPDSLEITRQDFITAVQKNNVYWMSTGGKKRDYLISYEWGRLRFTPGKWYKGEDPWIHFYRKEMDN